MSDTQFDAIVIGSGPGGTSCATLLQKRGVRTLLVEKNDLLGGKMISIEKDGYAYDLFPHGQVPMTQPAFYQIYEELGVVDEWAPALSADDPRDIIRIAYRARDWKEYREVTQGQAMEDSTPFFKLWDIPESEQERIMEFMTGMVMMEEEELRQLDDVTMHDYLMRHDLPDAIYSYLAFHANASLAESVDRVAASEQILIMQQMMLEGGGGQYKGGFGQLTKVMIREFEKNGGTVMRQNRVERILIENGVAAGVVTAKGTFRAPVVVSSAGLQPTVLKLIEPQHLEQSYRDYVAGLEPGWAFTSIRYFLKEPVMDVAMYVTYSDDSWWNKERYDRCVAGETPEEVILFMVNHSFYDENAAPPGKQVLVSGTICPPDPDSDQIEALWKVMDEQMVKLFPKIWEATERREYGGPRDISKLTRDSVLPGHGGECVGLGQIAGQCGQFKPKSKSPIPGLYFSGADAGAAGMGTHQSALSGMAVADMVGDYLGELRANRKAAASG
jgi:phytoene dehydrogenase-like protein